MRQRRELRQFTFSTGKRAGRARALLISLIILISLILFLYLICNQFGFIDFFVSVTSKVSLRLGGRVLLTRSLGWEGGLLAILIVPIFCMEGGLSGTTSGAETSEHEKEAGIGQHVFEEAQPQGEGSSNFEAGPSSRKDLNLSPHPRKATEELFNDLLQADRRLEELMGKAPSLRNAQDLDAWGREFNKEKEFFSHTEERLKWAIENEKELYASEDEKWAQQKADLHSQMEPFLQEEAQKRKAREALFSQVSQEARGQYELDRENQRQRFSRR